MSFDFKGYSDEYRKGLVEMAERIADIPHAPALKIIDDEKKEKYFMVEDRNGHFSTTEKIARAEKIGDFCYIEEEHLAYLVRECRKRGLELKTSEYDTKILKSMFPEKDFDAYSFDPVGKGLNLDGLTRISGRLYKLAK